MLAATPIGDTGDASPRLVRLLAEADVVAAEDTRRLRRLTSALGVQVAGRVVSHHEHNEASSTPELVAMALAGATVALVTDAGMPAVSDPGYRLTRAMVDAGVPVSTAPGPSAALAALAVSGLPTDRFAFEGFLPRKNGPRARALAALADDPRTLLFFEAPHRTAATLRALAEAFGADRPAALCRELTKTYEEVRRGGLGELADHCEAHQVLGEVTLVVAGAARGGADPADLVAEVLERAAAGERLKDAAKVVAGAHAVPVRGLYDAALAARRPLS